MKNGRPMRPLRDAHMIAPMITCSIPGHRCRVCAPELVPRDQRQGDHHFGVRFGGHDHRLRVWLDGRRLDNCFEAIAGPRGTVWCYLRHQDGAFHRHCQSGFNGACLEVLHGFVQVTSWQVEVPQSYMGIPLVADPTMPDDRIELRQT